MCVGGNCVPDGGPGPYCGDGYCDGSESCRDCTCDCGHCPPVCSDGLCNGVETCVGCPDDCGPCPGPGPDPEPEPEPGPLGPPTVECSYLADGRLQVLISGDAASGLVSPSSSEPLGLVACGSGVGPWADSFDPGSGANPFAGWDTADGMEFLLPADADGFSFAAVLPDGSPDWLCVGECGDAWTFSGDCHADGTLIMAGAGTEPDPEPEPGPGPAGTIRCTLTASALTMEVFGPITGLLADDALEGEPTGIYAGCGNCGGWSLLYGESDPRPWAEWLGDSGPYALAFPPDASGINLALADAVGNLAWFDLEATMTTERWSVTGDCAIEGTLIVQR